MLNACYPRSGRQPPTQVGDLSPKGRVAEVNDKKDSTIIKIVIYQWNIFNTYEYRITNLIFNLIFLTIV
ncbi:MAG: hypothetical protein LBB88_09270 [Planctomycetaceae bacterium]|nr:hypothetical protein [Planctomycetaceae bacterium]